MKNTPRNFVVEYKKRRPRLSGHILWGNVDLKSVAREVAQEIDNKFKQIEPTEFIPDIKVSSSLRAGTSIFASVKGESLESNIKSQPASDTAPDILTAAQPLFVRRSKKPAQQRTSREGKGVTFSPIDKLQDGHWLVLLEENEKLKRELVTKLRSENKHMIRMLKNSESSLL